MERISKVVYINLAHRTDRRKHMEKQFENFGIQNYQRFDAIRKCDNGAVGCAQSHLEVLKMAKEEDLDTVLILEDDFTFLVSSDELRRLMTTLFQEVPHFDVCFLAYNLRRSEPLPNSCVADRVLCSQTSSGYIVQKHYYQKLIDLYEHAIPMLITTGEHWNYAYDTAWKCLQEKDLWIRFTTRIGFQIENYSDLAGCVVRYEC